MPQPIFKEASYSWHFTTRICTETPRLAQTPDSRLWTAKRRACFGERAIVKGGTAYMLQSYLTAVSNIGHVGGSPGARHPSTVPLNRIAKDSCCRLTRSNQTSKGRQREDGGLDMHQQRAVESSTIESSRCSSLREESSKPTITDSGYGGPNSKHQALSTRRSVLLPLAYRVIFA